MKGAADATIIQAQPLYLDPAFRPGCTVNADDVLNRHGQADAICPDSDTASDQILT